MYHDFSSISLSTLKCHRQVVLRQHHDSSFWWLHGTSPDQQCPTPEASQTFQTHSQPLSQTLLQSCDLSLAWLKEVGRGERERKRGREREKKGGERERERKGGERGREGGEKSGLNIRSIHVLVHWKLELSIQRDGQQWTGEQTAAPNHKHYKHIHIAWGLPVLVGGWREYLHLYHLSLFGCLHYKCYHTPFTFCILKNIYTVLPM